MCVIIHQQKDKRQVTYDEFVSSWHSNPHGFGMLYFDSEKNRVVPFKCMTLADSWREYKRAADHYLDTDFVLHFRYSTHGSIGLDNCHPFYTGDGSYLVHNGVLGYSSTKKGEEDFSDTKLLAMKLLSLDDWLNSDIVCDFVNSVCTWDKILVMDKLGQVHYFGAKGTMSADLELWASNGSPFEYELPNLGCCKSQDGFYEDGVWVTNQEYCERYGIPYDAREWA